MLRMAEILKLENPFSFTPLFYRLSGRPGRVLSNPSVMKILEELLLEGKVQRSEKVSADFFALKVRNRSTFQVDTRQPSRSLRSYSLPQ